MSLSSLESTQQLRLIKKSFWFLLLSWLSWLLVIEDVESCPSCAPTLTGKCAGKTSWNGKPCKQAFQELLAQVKLQHVSRRLPLQICCITALSRIIEPEIFVLIYLVRKQNIRIHPARNMAIFLTFNLYPTLFSPLTGILSINLKQSDLGFLVSHFKFVWESILVLSNQWNVSSSLDPEFSSATKHLRS